MAAIFIPEESGMLWSRNLLHRSSLFVTARQRSPARSLIMTQHSTTRLRNPRKSPESVTLQRKQHRADSDALPDALMLWDQRYRTTARDRARGSSTGRDDWAVANLLIISLLAGRLCIFVRSSEVSSCCGLLSFSWHFLHSCFGKGIDNHRG